MADMSPLPRWASERAQRASARRLAAAMVTCMADTDTCFAQIAGRIDRTEEEVRQWLYDLIAGDGKEGIDRVSDFLLAMGAELAFDIRPLSFSLVEETAESEAVAA